MEFTTRTLGETCDEVDGVIQTGPFGSQLHQSDYRDEGTPVVMPKGLADDRVSIESIARIGEEDVERLARHKLENGDIVYARRGDIGRRALITSREAGWMCGTGCMRISLGDTILNPRFLFYYLGQPDIVTWIYNQAVGATMPNLNTSIVRSVPVKYPPLPTQRKIAAVLSAYDDLIENNTRRIAVLEQMARLLYQEWFVRFRFPGHEDVALVDSELGPTPEGWEVKQIGDVIELAYGKGLRKDDRIAGPYPVYGSSGIVDYHKESLVQGPGIIVGRKGNVGTVYWSDEAFYPIDTVFYVQTDVCLHYVYYNLQEQNFISTDTAVPGLNRNQAYLLPFLLPNASTMQVFQEIVIPIFRQVRNLKLKNTILRRTRDLLLLLLLLLLPRLVSGQVDVSALEIAVE